MSDSDLIEADPEPPRPRDPRALRRGILFVALIVAVTAIVAATAIHLKRAEFRAGLERRLEILATGRAQVVESWLDGVSRPAGRIADSEMFRLFATEVDLSGGGLGLRSRRFSAIVDDRTVTALNLEEEGSRGVAATGAATILSQLQVS